MVVKRKMAVVACGGEGEGSSEDGTAQKRRVREKVSESDIGEGTVDGQNNSEHVGYRI